MSTRVQVVAAASGLALAAACSPAAPPAPIDLRAAAGVDDLTPSGVAVDPTGARYVFDAGRGLYQLDGASMQLVLPLSSMPDPGTPVRPPYTDIAAVGPGQLAITAIGDGYLLDVARGTMRQWFCYVPSDLPEPYDQRTDAVAYDPDAGLLYAQPRTFDAGGALIASQVASYSYETGADLDWVNLETVVAAGGMAKIPGYDGLTLGVGTTLCNLSGIALSETIDLAPLGVASIDGLAVDHQANTLLVLDGVQDQLFELDLASLER
ncbi:MAG TPA: hypothetical protein VHE35_21680 [Kofleriaceae bacterium]|nr:hypothetical protein [Kofleriaceae bacterium]